MHAQPPNWCAYLKHSSKIGKYKLVDLAMLDLVCWKFISSRQQTESNLFGKINPDTRYSSIPLTNIRFKNCKLLPGISTIEIPVIIEVELLKQ